MDNTNFNHEEYYEKEIAPLVEEIFLKCRAKNIPCLLSFCTYQQEDDNIPTKYQTKMLSPFTAGVRLSSDYISECLKVFAGYKVNLVEEETINMDELMDFSNIEYPQNLP